jgi:hypothetical protein
MQSSRGHGWVAAVGALALVAASCSGSPRDQAHAAGAPGAPITTVPVTIPPTIPVTTTTTPITSPDQVSAPASAADTVTVLTQDERGLRTGDASLARLLPLGWQQQLAYGALSAHPDWVDTVLAAVPPDIRPEVAANVEAEQQLASPTLGLPPTSLPDWTILTPPAPDVLIGFYQEAAAESGVPWEYFAAINFVESRTGRIHGNSTAGAQGPMQFEPGTWSEYGAGGDIDDPHDAILAAGRFFAANGGATDTDRALYAYNPSDFYVAAIKDYAGVMTADPRAFDGYYAWQVYVTTTSGTMLLPEGWHNP